MRSPVIPRVILVYITNIDLTLYEAVFRIEILVVYYQCASRKPCLFAFLALVIRVRHSLKINLQPR
jgi:hypothetical protein